MFFARSGARPALPRTRRPVSLLRYFWHERSRRLAIFAARSVRQSADRQLSAVLGGQRVSERRPANAVGRRGVGNLRSHRLAASAGDGRARAGGARGRAGDRRRPRGRPLSPELDRGALHDPGRLGIAGAAGRLTGRIADRNHVWLLIADRGCQGVPSAGQIGTLAATRATRAFLQRRELEHDRLSTFVGAGAGTGRPFDRGHTGHGRRIPAGGRGNDH